MSGFEVVLILAWGTFAGLDLITGPQSMAARPLVSGTVAGWILGDPVGGFAVGALLELCAFEIMPFGSARYADYGLGAIAAAVVSAGTPDILGIGLGLGVGLVIALLGDLSTQRIRRANSRDALKNATGLDEGDVNTIVSVHFRCVLRDGLRALVVTAIGMVLAGLVRRYGFIPLSSAVAATVAAVGVAFGSAMVSGVRYGRATRLGVLLFAIGIIGGTAWVTVA
jgi:mannose/fructose/N-acetylgalactosamine-specific phosphotransferase system component IIC